LGAPIYAANCSGCHGADPATNILNVKTNGSTVAGLTAAFALPPMTGFQAALSATDKTNLAAFIASR